MTPIMAGPDCGLQMNMSEKGRGIMPTRQVLTLNSQDLQVNATEAEEAIKRMKSGKTTGPDDITSAYSKAKSCDPTLWVSEFFNRVIQKGRTPSDWQESIKDTIWKEKGSPENVHIPIRFDYFPKP